MAWFGNWFGNWFGRWFGPASDEASEDAGDKGLMLRVGADDDGLPVHAKLTGTCHDLAAGERGIGLVVGADENGLPIIGWSKQLCDDDGNLEVGKRYIGLVVGADENGLPIIGSFCKDCCYCNSVTSYGLSGYNGEPTGPVMYCRITSSAYPTPQVFPIMYTANIYHAINASIVATIPFTLSNWPMFPSPTLDPNHEGWWMHSQGFPHPVLTVVCSPGNFYHLVFEIRRCDMKVYVTQSRLINGLTTPEYRYKVYTQCDDPDDIIQCDPFYVRRKMDFSTALVHPGAPSLYYDEPLTSCTGTGSDCTGEDYVELYFTPP